MVSVQHHRFCKYDIGVGFCINKFLTYLKCKFVHYHHKFFWWNLRSMQSPSPVSRNHWWPPDTKVPQFEWFSSIRRKCLKLKGKNGNVKMDLVEILQGFVCLFPKSQCRFSVKVPSLPQSGMRFPDRKVRDGTQKKSKHFWRKLFEKFNFWCQIWNPKIENTWLTTF